jgi:SAM-dependent methyltransferase
MSITPSNPRCNICGGVIFGPGPAGRMADSGMPPCCTQCGSLERHRANRSFFQCLPIGSLSWRRALQFSPDTAVESCWFQSHEVSVYGGSNSLDLQRIDRPSDSYDFVTLCHVLEFVPNDEASFDELIRILSPEGLLHIVLSKPLSRPTSMDYALATGTHQYFHLYGLDFAQRFRMSERSLHSLVMEAVDPVTAAREAIHFVAKSPEVLEIVGMVAVANSKLKVILDPHAQFDLQVFDAGFVVDGS